MAGRRKPPPLDITIKREFKMYNPTTLTTNPPEQKKIPDLIFLTDIIPNLAIGTIEQAQNIELLEKHNITHVLNITRNPFPDWYSSSIDSGRNIKSLQIPIDDTIDTVNGNIIKHFPEGFKFIDSAIENNGNILVHCQAGISRSPAFIIGYIIWKENQNTRNHQNGNTHGKIADYGTLEYYMAMIRKYRPGIGPNLNFCGQLLMFYNSIHRFIDMDYDLETICTDVLAKM